MRLWTLHPQYLDSRGLVALWREALLAQKVLAGETRGYRNHPQLTRFRAHPHPMNAIATYLRGIADEAARRQYRFDTGRILGARGTETLQTTTGQLQFEWTHLVKKLQQRSPALAARQADVIDILPHPMFTVVEGPIESWERGRD